MSTDTELDVVNPSNSEAIATLVMDSREIADEKLVNAALLFRDRKRWLPLHERLAILERLAKTLEAEAETFALTIATEGGKPLTDARVEVTRAIAGIRTAIEIAGSHQGNVIPLGQQVASAGRTSFTQAFPRGVVLAFSAFNHPLNLIVHQVIPAFAAGCPCVVKPAPDTPLSCVNLVKAMHEAGVPNDYASVVITNDLEIADAMVRSDKIAFFSFIGSAAVGWMLRSRLQPGVRCALEHGGVAPCIVTSSADLDKAVPAIAKGGYYHAGQVCVSTQRVYVEQSIYEDFNARLSAAVSALVVGDATQETTEVGPLIRPQEAARVYDWVEEAREMGAIIAVGGEAPRSNFMQPTLILSPPVDAKVSCREIFGPVVCVYPFEDLEHALSLANIEPYAFQASIFTSDLKQMYAAFEAFDASAVMVNDHTAFRDDVMPFAGLNQSGLGVGGIPYTIEEMQFEKMLVIKQN